MNTKTEMATFAGGCFWCTEAVYQKLRGVLDVVPGYAGGSQENPTYEMVSTGTTGHAEAVQITFDPAEISYSTLLDVFWQTHDPTTLNRQGNDVGPQYRSAIFFHSDAQKDFAQASKQALQDSGAFSEPIVTEITAYTQFFPAEDYHKNYFLSHKEAPYCSFVIEPKITQLEQHFPHLLK